MARKKREDQMDMFEMGGLKDEGGSVDPVSGNDVPNGSLKEEVRDDIDAKLSEGEFVLPADVVRYIGLENIMKMRDMAKEGLAKMDAMGQMGNSEEATMDDETDFDSDIDSFIEAGRNICFEYLQIQVRKGHVDFTCCLSNHLCRICNHRTAPAD